VADSINSYRDLIAWHKADAFGKALYRAAAKLPQGERFGLAAALRRLSYSIASHIAQGYGRGNTQDYIYFLKHARGEIYQTDTQISSLSTLIPPARGLRAAERAARRM
jgi:four helix bundle protein